MCENTESEATFLGYELIDTAIKGFLQRVGVIGGLLLISYQKVTSPFLIFVKKLLYARGEIQ